MIENELKKIIDELEQYAKDHNLTDQEKETIYRARLMPYFTTGRI